MEKNRDYSNICARGYHNIAPNIKSIIVATIRPQRYVINTELSLQNETEFKIPSNG